MLSKRENVDIPHFSSSNKNNNVNFIMITPIVFGCGHHLESVYAFYALKRYLKIQLITWHIFCR